MSIFGNSRINSHYDWIATNQLRRKVAFLLTPKSTMVKKRRELGKEADFRCGYGPIYY
jgi:hypothetical protein